MTNNTNINGKWSFVIIYGPEYGKDENQELYCDVEFSQSEEEFIGTCIDTEGYGRHTETATIKGFINEEVISFVKQYPTAHFSDENGILVIDKDKPGPEINYFGSYNEPTDTFNGTWDIVVQSQAIAGDWYDALCTGTWIMKRK